jgi:hypothetical protein
MLAPVPAVDMQDAAQRAEVMIHEVRQRPRSAESKANPHRRVSAARQVSHSAGVLEIVTERLPQSTCLPAATKPSTISRCRWFATTTLTTLMWDPLDRLPRGVVRS